MNDIHDMRQLTLAEKRELVHKLLRQKKALPANRFPLSQGQQSLWFVYQLAPRSPAYNFLYAAQVEAAIDLGAFERACRALSQRHPALRTTFAYADQVPVQEVHEELDWAIGCISAADWPPERLREEIQAEADRPFDLERGAGLRVTLFQLGAGRQVLCLVIHHIIADLWSMDLLIRELRVIYAAECSGRLPALPRLTHGYADYVRWQAELVAGPRAQKAWEFWQSKLAGELPLLNLPTDRPRPVVQTYRGAAHTWPIDSAVSRQLRELARAQNTTLFTTIMAVFYTLLCRYTGQEDLIVGTTTVGRNRLEWESVVGYFLNQLPLRVRLLPTFSFAQLLQQVRAELLQAFDHQDFPWRLLVERLQPVRDASRSPLFQVMFIWDKPAAMDEEPAEAGKLPLKPLAMEQRGAPFDLTLIVFEVAGKLTATLRYNVELFDAATVARMAGHFERLLAEAALDPQQPIGKLSLMSPAERRQLVEEWNATRGPGSAGHYFPQVFEQQVERTPDAPAVIFGAFQLSYRELNERANRLAQYLRQRGAGRNQLVGICLERSFEIAVAILAVWKAGAAYVPLNPTLPPRRLAWLLDDARPLLVLTTADQSGRLPEQLTSVVLLDRAAAEISSASAGNSAVVIEPDDLAYVIYTSGSTGEPKGVLLPHRGLRNLFEAQRQVYDPGPDCRILQFSALSFDASVYELMALGTGAALVLAPQAALIPGPGLIQLLREQSVTMITLPPSVLAALPDAELPALKTIIVAGEACSAELVSRWAPGRDLYNAYGPTETTVWASVARCRPDGKVPSIGRPILNTRTYVLDANLQPVPVGVWGELHIAGPGVGLGYVNRPELTALKFIPNPFEDEDGAVLYKTGDIVRYRADGELEFGRRVDQQLKIRGYRIEPGEIEATLRQYAGVRDAVVVPKDDAGGPVRKLVAYVVPGTVDVGGLQAFLRERLPHYMLPWTIVPLEAFPLTAHGKLDRAALPRASADAIRSEQTPPRTPLEKRLVEIWGAVLAVPHVGIHDNFFDLGGASIQTVEVVERARQAGLELAPELLFQHQTVAELAAAYAGPPLASAGKTSLNGSALPLMPATLPVPVNGATTLKESPPARTVIESLGVYLPPRAVSTAEVLAACKRPLKFPLERLSGIKTRRMAGETEFSIDLAKKAIADCLERSNFRPQDIDLLVCCNISRCDAPDRQFMYEPTTALRLKHHFGFSNALGFDITNACAGTFTGIALADALLHAGQIRRALVVSGEYISYLARNAQKQLESFMDPRLACLTLGDSGSAVTLELRHGAAGFHDLRMYTLAQYWDLCVAKGLPGGPIMLTDPVKASTVTIQQAVGHALQVAAAKKSLALVTDFLILHQTSETTLNGAVAEINRAVGEKVCHRGNVLYNLAERGNTSTTTHFVALMDYIQKGTIQPGNRVLFGISGSGQTVGSALYTLDDLPERIRTGAKPAQQPIECQPVPQHRVRIESVGTLPEDRASGRDSRTLAAAAGEACLGSSSIPRQDVDLLIHAGIYKSEFMGEPALAAAAAAALKLNHDAEALQSKKTFAFDLLNGAVGVLNACHVAAGMIAAGKYQRALILASEVENNADVWPDRLLGLKETASALLLTESNPTGPGFGRFLFRSFPAHLGRLESYLVCTEEIAALAHHRDPEIEGHYLDCIVPVVGELLQREGVTLADIKVILPPQISARFRARLASALDVPGDRLVDLPDGNRDYFTSSLAYSYERARHQERVAAGDLGLLIAVGAGIEVGCVLYYF